MRLIFAGTPRTAVPALEALLASRHEVVAVLTRPGAPAGRGGHRERGGRTRSRPVQPGPVAVRARAAGLEVLAPARARDPVFLDRLRDIAPDCCPVAAYGALLPAWRGAAPVQHAIANGDDITGASTFQIVEELDAGPVFMAVKEPIRPADTTGDLVARLAIAGARLLVETLDGIGSGTLTARPQPAERVSFAPKVTSADARVDWACAAQAIDRLVRACTPDPGAWTTFRGTRVKLGPVMLVREPVPVKPGELAVHDGAVLAGTGSQPVMLGEVQAEGKRGMPATEWARGLRLSGGERLV